MRARTSTARVLVYVPVLLHQLSRQAVGDPDSADTVSVLTARLAGDSPVGRYDSRFATTGARVFRRIAR